MKNNVELFTDTNGSNRYYLNGILHREDGPAVELYNRDKYWYFNGKLHRESGPAIQLNNGDKWWYFHGKYIDCFSQIEFEEQIKLAMFW
jgi:hypothetical protein